MLKQFLIKNAYKLSVTWALIIFVLCATPGRFIPSANWLELLSFDKWVHAGVFFILVSLLGVASKEKTGLFYLYVALSVLYGGALEIMQATVFSERSADWYDMIANTFGCIVALLLNKKIKSLVLKSIP